MAAGADVVSTCEELAYPWRDNPETAEAIDATARDHGVTCLGTGINPGFAMDAFPAVLSTVSRRVDSVRVERVQDASTRRRPLQEKIGAGTSVETFESEVATAAGHVGLPESVAMLAAAMGWELDAVDEAIEPVIADERTASDYVTVEPGEVAGISQTGTGVVGGQQRIELALEMYLGAPDPHDTLTIEGTPDLTYTVPGGFHGDVTTPAVVVNAARRLPDTDPGLRTMLDLPAPSCAEF
jgi:4-hydroxy-tetrahydrodipicolinate reductase